MNGKEGSEEEELFLKWDDVWQNALTPQNKTNESRVRTNVFLY